MTESCEVQTIVNINAITTTFDNKFHDVGKSSILYGLVHTNNVQSRATKNFLDSAVHLHFRGYFAPTAS